MDRRLIWSTHGVIEGALLRHTIETKYAYYLSTPETGLMEQWGNLNRVPARGIRALEFPSSDLRTSESIPRCCGMAIKEE